PDVDDELERLAALWVRGGEPDWARLHVGKGRRRVALPTYPFARRRCWVHLLPRDTDPIGPGSTFVPPRPPGEGRGEGGPSGAGEVALTPTLSRRAREPEMPPRPPGEGRGEGWIADAGDEA